MGLFLVVLLLIGCSNAFSEHVTGGDALLEAGKFDLALKSYEMALEEKEDSTEVKEKITLLEKYEELVVLIEEGKLDEAEKLIEDLQANEYMVDSLTEELEGLVEKIETAQAENEQVDEELDEVEKLVKNKDIKEAKLLLKEIEKDRDVAHAENRVDKLGGAIKKAEKRKKAEEKKAKEKTEKEQLAKEKAEQASNYQHYHDEYDKIAAHLKDFFENTTSVSTADIVQDGAYGYEMWDTLLNDIWGVLENDLPSGEFESLKAKQIDWIKQKEAKADELAHYDNGSIGRIYAIEHKYETTRERVRYLLDHYMK